VAFATDDLASEPLARQLGRAGIFVSHGDFYAHTVVARLGRQAEGIARAGCACYTSPEDVDRLLEGIRQLSARESLPV
jgi:selenocysteine lyase/cysteine desulfurase